MKKQKEETGANGSLRTWLYRSAVAVLVVGLFGAALIYKSSADRSQEYRNRAGQVLPSPDNSKQYLRQMELYGGTANVLAYEFRTWFVGLWQGTTLAYTIIFLTLLVSSGLLYVASCLPRDKP
ncbi:MAG: hypothetical protein ACP5SH_05875 [Syntrophobacteraceae bacterium]